MFVTVLFYILFLYNNNGISSRNNDRFMAIIIYKTTCVSWHPCPPR